VVDDCTNSVSFNAFDVTIYGSGSVTAAMEHDGNLARFCGIFVVIESDCQIYLSISR